ncbi:hypothetical protein [Streptomyces sp. NPDC051909]|uniref:hypothetical protein n=1 Tax=Streptomyces sp. NPDC051909 TaxID=3154944 RepID=UPI00343A1A36
MQPLPLPCPADLIPDATTGDAFTTAYQQAQRQHAVFIAVERQGPRWTVKADLLTAGAHHTLDEQVYDTVREAVLRLIRTRQIRMDSVAGPVYFVLYDVETEERARELAAALHTALYRDPRTAHTRRPGILTGDAGGGVARFGVGG